MGDFEGLAVDAAVRRLRGGLSGNSGGHLMLFGRRSAEAASQYPNRVNPLKA